MIFKHNILYCGGLISQQMMDYLFLTSKIKPSQNGFKYFRLLIEGLVLNECKITVLSSIPVSNKTHKKIFWRSKFEMENGIIYFYLPFVNLPYIRQIFLISSSFIFTFFRILFRGINLIICDVLGNSVSIASLLAAKITRTKTIAIVTDLPQFIQDIEKSDKLSLFSYIGKNASRTFISHFDAYVLITDQMNKFVNVRRKAYWVIEGLVDIKMKSIGIDIQRKKPRTILYSGGICEIYGVKKLIEAFMLLEQNDLQLSIYGGGEMEQDMIEYCKLDNRIVYHGIVPNKEVVMAQLTATLLVNPRPSTEEYTKYSFPSKNMEYMASGTPVLTTILPGMPKEYYDYVYFFEDETIDGFVKTLNLILRISEEELYEKGRKAKEFVMGNKNNIIQSESVLRLVQLL